MNDYIEQLETDLAEARKAALPVTVEVVKHTRDEKVSVSSNGTTRTDYLGGKPVEYLPGHVPVVAAPPVGLAPVPKEVGKVIKENEDERITRLVSGSVRTELK
ncbi:MAG: hypothetical protein U0223_16895 [Nitrospira sp.]|nr:hypothetical protein [Nitrospira sp.]